MDVEFGEADKESLVRIVKELQKEGAQGDKVRASPSERAKTYAAELLR